MCLQHAALWQGWCHCKEVPKSPPPWHKEGYTAQGWAMGGATAKSCLPFFRGRDPDSTRWIGMFYSFQLSLQSTKITLCSPTPIQIPKNPINLLMIYSSSYCTFCQGKPGQGLQWFFVCWCEMTNLSATFFISQTFALTLTDNTFAILKTPCCDSWDIQGQSLSRSFKAFSCTTLLPGLGAHICWATF